MGDPHSMKQAVIRVLGCKVNQAEAAAMAAILEDRGYRVDPSPSDPNLILVHTCCVTAKAEGKSRRAVKRLAETYPHARMLITGCLAEVNPLSVQEISDRITVLGTFEKDRLAELLDVDGHAGGQVHHRGSSACTSFADLGCAGIPGRGRAFLKVQDGCSQGCAYCIVPTARGPSRSLPLERAVAHGRSLAEKGFAEIVLTGIHLGWYGRDLQPSVGPADLLERLLRECPSVRFRLSSLEPQDISPRLISLVTQHERVCRHFHVPLQSGDDGILKRMRRPYDMALIHRLLESIYEADPDTCVGFDVMVAFPGESDRSFRTTESFVREARAAYLHVFPFSPRPGTAAASFHPSVPDGIATSRVEALRGLSADLRSRFARRFIGRVLTVVPEEAPGPEAQFVKGRTDNYIPVKLRVPCEFRAKRFFDVLLERLEEGEVTGSVVVKPNATKE